MRKTALVLFAFVLPSLGCVVRLQTIPDPTIPHRVAREAEVEIWVRQPDGTLVKRSVRLLEGWWIAGPPVVEGESK